MADLLAMLLVLLTFAVVPVFTAIWGCRAVRRWYEKIRAKRDGLEWKAAAVVPMPLQATLAGIIRIFDHAGYNLLQEQNEEYGALYWRGDWNITRLPAARQVGWSEVPVFASACCYVGDNENESALCLKFDVASFVRVSPRLREFCLGHLKDECDRTIASLMSAAEELTKRQAERARSEAAAAARDADFALLGLGRGASWELVKGAYRDCCMKYHPDRFSGQNVAPHLVDLAITRFKEINAAYQRLKDRMAPAGSNGSPWTAAPRGGGSSH